MKIFLFLLLNVIISRNLLSKRRLKYSSGHRNGGVKTRRVVKRKKNNLLTKEASRLAHAT